MICWTPITLIARQMLIILHPLCLFNVYDNCFEFYTFNTDGYPRVQQGGGAWTGGYRRTDAQRYHYALNAFKNPLNTGYPVQALSEPVNTISTTYNIFSLSPNQQQDFEDVDFSTLTSPLGAKSEEKILECEISNI